MAAAAAPASPANVGFIGAGIMGVPMALNLIKAGHTLTVWNRTAAACQPLVDAGATLAASAADCCAASEAGSRALQSFHLPAARRGSI